MQDEEQPEREETLGDRVRSMREARGLSLNHMARLTGLSVQGLWNIEAQGVRPNKDTIDILARLFSDQIPPGFDPSDYLIYGRGPLDKLVEGSPQWVLICQAQTGLSDEAMRSVERIVRGLVLEQMESEDSS